jgi:predicted alpha/beta hydrolase family esterase
MQQVVVIHGGDAFEKYEDYLQSLREKTITLERLRQKDWKSNLQKDLGENYDVLAPRLPNAQNARYGEWKIIFDKIMPLLSDNVILIGHSLGGLFLAKYLSENQLSKKIKATILIAAPFSTREHEPIGDFMIERSLARLEMTGGKLLLYHSQDDVVVPFANVEKYHASLPEAELRVFEDRGHFNQESFPELVEEIKSLNS